MFDHLKQFSRILVTGPQRSGTTICARIIEDELAYTYVDEDQISVWSLSGLFDSLKRDRVVIQAPAMSAIVQWIDTPSTAVVFMRRDVKDILASQKRIGWDFDDIERKNYFKRDGAIAPVRYDVWDNFQRDSMRVPWFEVNYQDLSSHWLWIDSSRRDQFAPRQFQ